MFLFEEDHLSSTWLTLLSGTFAVPLNHFWGQPMPALS